jgi:hypothetical protein
VEGLATEALNKLETKAESAAESAIIGNQPSAAPTPTAPADSTARASSTWHVRMSVLGSPRLHVRPTIIIRIDWTVVVR